MAVRGVYTKEEEKMLAKFEETAESSSGWRKSFPTPPVATEASIRSFAFAADYWNPLWRDESYAKNTRWGGIIATPMYEDPFAQWSWFIPEVPPSVGYGRGAWLGEDWEFFNPIHVNDALKVWRRRPKLIDITSLDGKGPRVIAGIPHDTDVINQKDEIVSTLKLYNETAIYPERPQPPKLSPQPVYVYTKEELAYIDRVFEEEEIRGAKIRWWEDVKVGEELRPVIMGPLTLWDAIVYTAGRQEMEMIPMMEVRRRGEMLVLDPATGVTHHGIEWHHSDEVARLSGLPFAMPYGVTVRQLMARCVTNWMGDDGFLRKFHWRTLAGNFRLSGDTAMGHGRVIKKRVENGEHLVDLSVWAEHLRGDYMSPAAATVRLLSKEEVL